MRITSHKSEIINRFAKAYRACEVAYDDGNREVIETPRDWPSGFGTTYRQNGQIVVGSNRDIVDLGELRDSQSYQRTDDYKTEYSWSADHALYVHEGYVTSKGNQVPARRWTEEAVEEVDLPKVFVENFNE